MKEIITNNQALLITTLFILGNSITLPINTEAGSDFYLAFILGMIISMPLVLIYSKILRMFPNKNIFMINQVIFGKFLSKLINSLFTFYCFYLGCLVLREFSEFITNVTLKSTPQYVIMFFILSFVIWAIKLGLEPFSRWCELFGILLIILLLIIITFFLSTIDWSNLKPFLADGIFPVIETSQYSVYYPLCESVILLGVFNNLKNNSKMNKIFIFGVIISGILILIYQASAFLSMGPYIYSINHYPVYVAMSRINIFPSVERLEIIIAVTFLISGFVKLHVCFFVTCKGISHIVNCINYKSLIWPISLLAIVISLSTFKGTMETLEYIKSYNVLAIPAQIILPITILIIAKIKKKFSKI